MADIVLKDKNGSPVNYNPVPAKISVQGHDNDGEEKNYKYIRPAYLKCYSVNVVSDGVWLVTKQFASFNFEELLYTGFSENEMREYGSQNTAGSWGLNIIFTAKTLTVGNTYAVEDLVPGGV